MEILKISTQEVISFKQLRETYPNVAFPADPTDADLTEYDAAVITTDPTPSYDISTQTLEISEPTLIDGQWRRTWSVLPKPTVIPTSVTMRQARLALNSQSLLETIETNIVTMSKEVQIEWEYATKVDRSSPLVTQLAATLNLSETDLDDLFTLASTL